MANINNLTLQPTAVVEAELAPLPEIPDSLLKFAGVTEWWSDMRLNRERDKETLYRLLLTRSGAGSDRGGGSGISRITSVGKSVINAQANISNTTNNSGGGGGPTPPPFRDDDEEQLFLAWLGL